jgi:hypothetical protein
MQPHEQILKLGAGLHCDDGIVESSKCYKIWNLPFKTLAYVKIKMFVHLGLVAPTPVKVNCRLK